jgi:dTDP-4-dehydrorhamnose 3,5-epimerase
MGIVEPRANPDHRREAEPASIHGVQVVPMTMHHDDRGSFTEVYRDEWGLAIDPVQWNTVESHRNVLRGVHVHLRHADFLMLLQGRASIGLCDLRSDSPTHRRSTVVSLSGLERSGVVIPSGVAHGFYFHEASIHLYAVSRYWDPADELGCRWDDDQLGIDWPCSAPVLSSRDAGLAPLAELNGLVSPIGGPLA